MTGHTVTFKSAFYVPIVNQNNKQNNSKMNVNRLQCKNDIRAQ